jgi:hypothetical protein
VEAGEEVRGAEKKGLDGSATAGGGVKTRTIKNGGMRTQCLSALPVQGEFKVEELHRLAAG